MKEAVQSARTSRDLYQRGRKVACLGAGGLALMFFGGTAAAQLRLTPQQATARKSPDYSPALAGQMVTVQGIVSSPAIHFPGFTLLFLEQNHHGVALEVAETDRDVDAYSPGDQLEVDGAVSSRSGLVVILPAHIRGLGRQSAPSPEEVPVEELQSFDHLGQFI